jgi:nucleoside-diphosphate-sugar epimerase
MTNDSGGRAEGESKAARVLVTGSQGYIGSVLVDYLRDHGYDVVERDLGLYTNCRYPSGTIDPLGWDVREATPGDFDGVDAVVHLAALSNDPLGDLDPGLTYAINHDGTVRVAEAAKEAGVRRFVFASSCSLYGASGSGGLLDETAPMTPLTPYAETKVTAEAALAKLADDAFSPTYMRNATVYGPSPALRLDIVVNDLCATAAATGRILLKSDGSAWRPQVHVEDVARSVRAVLEAPIETVHDQAFNVGRTEDNLTINEIAELVSRGVPGGAPLDYADDAGTDPRSYRVDFTKISTLVPGFQPRWTLAEGIRQLLKVFLEDRISSDDFPRYRRLHEIRRLMAEGSLEESLSWAGSGLPRA